MNYIYGISFVLLTIHLILMIFIGNVSAFFSAVAQEPWIQFLVVDFYILLIILSLKILKEEKYSWAWFTFFVLSGSVGVLLYLAIKE